MRRGNLAWLLLPAAIIIIAVVTLVLSNYQKEAGLAKPGKSGAAAVAAVAEAREAASATDAPGYDRFSKSLAAGMVATRDIGITNPSETRLQIALTNTLDCLSASREAWQAQLEQSWDRTVDSSPDYWRTLHPALAGDGKGPLAHAQPVGSLSPEQVRQWAETGAGYWLQKAEGLVE